MKLAFSLFAICLLFSCSREEKPENRVAASFHAEELPNDFKVDLSKRKVFPFSVVPGGTVTRDEVKTKVASDPVVREHYKGIQIDKLKPFRLTKPAQGYVSYRIGNRIFWTAQRLYLKPGEILLSDGLNMIRGRCGNRISLVAGDPVQRVGAPSEAVLDLPSWDIPVFQAMADEANRRDSDGPLFEFRGNGPAPLAGLTGKIPEAVFNVAPPVVGPGLIGGGLPGGLPPADKGGEIIIHPSPVIFISSLPLTIPPPGILLPSITPIEIARVDLPPFFIGGHPIGIGGPVFFIGDLQFPPSVFVPPTYFPPSILSPGGTPPFLFIPPSVVVPPGESNPPPPVGPPTGPPTVRPEDPVVPPNAEPPPVFHPVPEPSTLGMVALAAALIYLLKRMPWQRQERCRSWGGRPLH